MMPPRNTRIYVYRGETFCFFFDAEHPEELHITRRHETTMQDAAETFFAGDPVWNEAHARFETEGAGRVIYWARYALDQSILIFSCFPKESP